MWCLEDYILMRQYMKRVPNWLSFILYGLLLVAILSACSFAGITIGSAPTPTPTPVPATTLVTYTGQGYTIGYPKSWKIGHKGNAITFTDPQGVASLAVGTNSNPGAVVTPKSILEFGLQLFKSNSKNYHRLQVAPTAKVGGDSWTQGAATGDIVPSGQKASVTVKTVVIADNHPANSPQTSAFTIVYATGQQVFDLADTGYFQ